MPPNSYLRDTYGLTQQRLMKLFTFDTETRRLIHRTGRKAGQAAGRVKKNRFARFIEVDGHEYSANQLVFLYIYGHWADNPNGENKCLRRQYPIHPELKDEE